MRSSLYISSIPTASGEVFSLPGTNGRQTSLRDVRERSVDIRIGFLSKPIAVCSSNSVLLAVQHELLA